MQALTSIGHDSAYTGAVCEWARYFLPPSCLRSVTCATLTLIYAQFLLRILNPRVLGQIRTGSLKDAAIAETALE